MSVNIQYRYVTAYVNTRGLGLVSQHAWTCPALSILCGVGATVAAARASRAQEEEEELFVFIGYCRGTQGARC
jgi:hypothetical protein